jgi:hypothetical protein
MFLISEVAALARSAQNPTTKSRRFNGRNSNKEVVFGWRERCLSEDDTDNAADQPGDSEDKPAVDGRNPYDSSSIHGLSSSQRTLIKQALEDWEEPERGAATLPVRAKDSFFIW